MQTTNENSEKNVNEPEPPPIYVDGVKNINPLMELLNEIVKERYIIKALNQDQVKVQPKTGEAYTIIVKALTEKNTQFHTYKPKQERSFRVVLKNLHYSTDINEIKESINSLGHDVHNIWNIKHNKTNKPLSMFFIDLKHKENNKEIYKIKTLMNTIVAFEAPYVKREIPQCIRCQRFGHIKNFCQRNPRCVKCAEFHLTSSCPRKIRDNEVKCVNCGENHPANYRGCLVHKQLQQKLYPALREKINTQPQAQPIHTQQIRHGMTYAQAVTNTHAQNNQPIPETNQPASNIAKLEEMMGKLLEQMGTMLNLLTIVVSKLA